MARSFDPEHRSREVPLGASKCFETDSRSSSESVRSLGLLSQFVFLISTKAGGVGLNITSANKVVIIDPHWNPSYDLQAQDRAYRIGQKRDVTIKHFIMTNSVEEWILRLQKKKEALASMSMSKRKTKMEDAKERMEELKDLFNPAKREHFKG